MTDTVAPGEGPERAGWAGHRPAPGTQHPRRRRQLDWELITCGFSGHVLVGRDAARARPEDAVVARDVGGVRWLRCLRCDSWIALPRPASPASDYPPDRDQIAVPLRGKGLRDRIVLRLIAIDRVFHFLIIGLLGAGVLLFAAHRHDLQAIFYRVVTAIQGGVAGSPVQTTGGGTGIIHDINELFTLRAHTLTELGIVLLAYATLEGVEAVGLWLGKRWAEYLTFIATIVLLPVEVYEIIHKGSVLKVIGFLINVAVVLWLLLRKRLFGLRGGGRAEEAERARDVSWETIERATPPLPVDVAASAVTR